METGTRVRVIAGHVHAGRVGVVVEGTSSVGGLAIVQFDDKGKGFAGLYANDLETLPAALRAIRDNEGRAPTVIERDGYVYVSAEDGRHFADYHTYARPWIHPDVVATAQRFGGFWEWDTPGAIVYADRYV